MNELNEYELEILKRLENKFSMDPEEESPFKKYPLIKKTKIQGTYVLSYKNIVNLHPILTIEEKFKNSDILLYSEKNRYQFLIEPLMTFWQNEIHTLFLLCIQKEMDIFKKFSKNSNKLKENLNKSAFVNILEIINKEYTNIHSNNIEEELNSFGISINEELIQISLYNPYFFINKRLFYEILLFFFESLHLIHGNQEYLKNFKIIQTILTLIP